MNTWLGHSYVVLLLLSVSSARAETYRYVLEDFKNEKGVNSLFDAEGWRVARVVFDSESNAKAQHVLKALTQLEDLQGTRKKLTYRNQAIDQRILVEGKLQPGDGERKFTLQGLKVRFPLTRIMGYANGDPDETWIETHLSFRTLFPNGLEYNGKPIDVKKFEEQDKSIKWEKNPNPQ